MVIHRWKKPDIGVSTISNGSIAESGMWENAINRIFNVVSINIVYSSLVYVPERSNIFS